MSEELRDKVRAKLVEALSPWVMDPDKVYVNGINNPEEQLVIESDSVTYLTYNYVREGVDVVISEEPVWGFFSAAWSFAPEHRVQGPDAKSFEAILNEIIKALR